MLRHVDEFERLTRRMGYWVDLSQAYRTMDRAYVESVWWSLQQVADKGLLVEDHRVAPYCPRCGTALSDHEVAQGYEEITDPSVYVRFPITPGEWAGRADLLVWTTTPWTLVSNTAVAVNPDVEYAVVRSGDLAPPDLVIRGEAVTVVFDTPGLNLSLRGQANENGRLGAAITVTNPVSKKVIAATVIGPGRVSVGPAPGRQSSAALDIR